MSVDRILILDCETTGLDPVEDCAIELGLVVYSVRHRTVLRSYSTLLASGRENTAEAINHIPSSALNDGSTPKQAWSVFEHWASKVDAIVAHRADFDRQFVPMVDRPWICTKYGVKWPLEDKPGQSLIYLALAHGLGVVDPHRALSDCMLIARLLTRCAELGHDPETILARGLRPMAVFQALVTFDDNHQAKSAGFEWEASTKRWLRKMAIEDAAMLEFRTAQVET